MTMMPGTEVLPAPDRRPLVGLGGARSGARPPACRVRRRVVVHGSGRRHAGLPAVVACAAGRVSAARSPGSASARCRDVRRTTSSSTARAGLPPARADTTTRRSAARWCWWTGVDLDRWWLDSTGPTYVVPRSAHVVVGGTEERGGLEPDPVAGHGHRHPRSGPPGWCPELAGARVAATASASAGAPAVRLEAEGGPCTATARAAPA